LLKPINKKRLSDAAVEQLKEMIIKEKIKPGEKLPSERQLIKELKISRASVREALRILEIMGFVEVKPGKGVYVADPTQHIFEPLDSWLSLYKETLYEHFEIRQVIEPHAASFAAKRATANVINAMKKSLTIFKKRMEQDDLIGMIKADAEFHLLIAKATGNRTLIVIMETITTSLLEGWKASLRTPGRASKTIEEHQAIFDAILNKDAAKAGQAMSTHLRNAVNELEKMGLRRNEV